MNLKISGQHDAVCIRTLTSILLLYETLRQSTPSLRDVMLQVPGVTEKNLQVSQELCAKHSFSLTSDWCLWVNRCDKYLCILVYRDWRICNRSSWIRLDLQEFGLHALCIIRKIMPFIINLDDHIYRWRTPPPPRCESVLAVFVWRKPPHSFITKTVGNFIKSR
mgnify:CR=1 FL=1